MRTKLLIFFIIIFCFCGRKSTNEKDNTGSVLRIDLLSEPGSKVTKLSEFAENIEYIPLQTTDSSLMGSVRHKIVYNGKRIYLKNTEGLSQASILCFDINGKFLFRIEDTGRGPEEYTNIEDFDVSTDNEFLTILSSLSSKLLFYGITPGGFTFQRSISLEDPRPYRISIVPETESVFLAIPPWRGTEPTLSLLINKVGDTIQFKPNSYQYKSVKKTGYRASNEMIVYSTGKQVCFKEVFSDTVFYVDMQDNLFNPRMILDSYGTLITPEVRAGSEPVGKHTNYIANIFETSRYVFYYYISSGPTRNRILFDKKTNTKYKLVTDNESMSKLEEDLSGGPDFNIEFLNNYCSGSKLFSFVDAITLKKYVESEDFYNAKVKCPKKKEELKKLADSLNETDNPVLIIVTPKE